jgi:hypothetical protein
MIDGKLTARRQALESIVLYRHRDLLEQQDQLRRQPDPLAKTTAGGEGAGARLPSRQVAGAGSGLARQAAPSPAPPRREARDELELATAFRVTARGTQLRRPRPGAIGDLDPDDAVPGPDRDRDRLPGSTRAAVPDRLNEGR